VSNVRTWAGSAEPLRPTKWTELFVVWMVVEKYLQAFETDHVYATNNAHDLDADVLRDIFEAYWALCICWRSSICMCKESGVISEESVNSRKLM
jgi:hypothetical protein